MLSKFVSPYKKSYSSNHVLLKLIEDWKKSLDEENIIGVVLMGLFKAFDCIPHDILMVFYGCNNIYLLVYEKKKTGSENK